MAELVNDKRVKFAAGTQKRLIQKCKDRLGVTHARLAEILGISARTLTDWKREKFLVPLKAARLLCGKSRVRFPGTAEIRERFWYTRLGASSGWKVVYRKYGYLGGDPEHRKKRWREWWEKTGKFKPHPIISMPRPVKKPIKTKYLAEFVGIMIGDGGLSKFQLRITLNRYDDKEYGKFVIKLIRNLFGVRPSIYHDVRNSVFDISVSRKKLVCFCAEE